MKLAAAPSVTGEVTGEMVAVGVGTVPFAMPLMRIRKEFDQVVHDPLVASLFRYRLPSAMLQPVNPGLGVAGGGGAVTVTGSDVEDQEVSGIRRQVDAGVGEQAGFRCAPCQRTQRASRLPVVVGVDARGEAQIAEIECEFDAGQRVTAAVAAGGERQGMVEIGQSGADAAGLIKVADQHLGLLGLRRAARAGQERRREQDGGGEQRYRGRARPEFGEDRQEEAGSGPAARTGKGYLRAAAPARGAMADERGGRRHGPAERPQD